MKSRPAHLVDRLRVDGVGESSLKGGLASGVLAQAGLKHAAEDRLVDVVPGRRHGFEHSLDGIGAELRRGRSTQAPKELAKRGTLGGENHWL